MVKVTDTDIGQLNGEQIEVIETYIGVNNQGNVDLMVDYADEFKEAFIKNKRVTEEEFETHMRKSGYSNFSQYKTSLRLFATTKITPRYTCKTRIYFRDVLTHNSGYIGELFEQLEVQRLIELCHLRVKPEFRRKGLGTSVIKSMIADYSNEVIVLVAGATVDEYEEPIYGTELDQLLERLCKLYKSLDFININEVVGDYDELITHLYVGNKAGKDLLYQLVKKTSPYDYISCKKFISRANDYLGMNNNK